MRHTIDVTGALKSILYWVISLIVLIVIALIFFAIIAYVVNWVGDLVFDGFNDSYGLLTAGILASGVLIGGAYGNKAE